MASWSKMNTGTKTAVGVVVLILFGGGGYGIWQATQPPAVVVTPVANVATAPSAETIAAAKTIAAADTTVAAGVVARPSMDLVRIEPDGTALVAGQAPAGALVTLLTNAVEVASTKADAAGKFVAMFTMPPSASGQMLSMVVTLADGSTVASTSQVAIATITAPVAVADAGTETAPAADTAGTVAMAPAIEAPSPTALAVTDAGVKVLQSGAATPAEVAGNVSLDLIAYPSPDMVQFGGHGTAGQFIRLYLDNAAFGEPIAIPPDGVWSVTLDGIAPGIHTLRVDQVDGSGKVTSRFETPFKRETPKALAAASGVVAPPSVVAGAAATTAPAADGTADASTTATADSAVTTALATTALATVGTTTAPATTEVPALPATEALAVTTAPAAAVIAEVPAADATLAADAAPQTPVVDSAAAAVAPPATETGVAMTGDAPAADITATLDASPKPAAPITITVQPGYTLWFIAKQNFGKGVLYVQVFNANKDKIKNPDLIYPGQVFTMPAN